MKMELYYGISAMLVVLSIVLVVLSYMEKVSYGKAFAALFVVYAIIASLPMFRIGAPELKTLVGVLAMAVGVLIWALTVAVLAKKWISFIPDIKMITDVKTAFTYFAGLVFVNYILLFVLSVTKATMK